MRSELRVLVRHSKSDEPTSVYRMARMKRHVSGYDKPGRYDIASNNNPIGLEWDLYWIEHLRRFVWMMRWILRQMFQPANVSIDKIHCLSAREVMKYY